MPGPVALTPADLMALEAFRLSHLAAADQLARMVLAGVSHWLDCAVDVRRPDHLMYRRLLEQWVKVMDRARATAVGIQLPLPGEPPRHGSGG